MKRSALERGAEGEDAAARYLEQKGLKVVQRHYQTRWGEIDLVCRDRDTWVFVEVKTRTRTSAPSAAEALTPAKQKKIIGAALSYMKKHRLKDEAMRFDLVTLEGGFLEWFAGAFEASGPYTY
ncbi:MAG: YraN family protein [Elusimicrobia bacterium RIFCSPLOWO2_01_FULL_59_12]|nr:MAG: YraN family protein [Elusimicrobia bacterium RIFCSPLOWO2_01_FULL_59_12]